MSLSEPTQYENALATKIIGCAMKIHRRFGPGLVESVYETCFCHELHKSGLSVHRQKPQPIIYDDITFDDPFRLDLFVEDTIIVENKPSKPSFPFTKPSFAPISNSPIGGLASSSISIRNS